ncbi:hypothetical protein ACFE04_022260 [Oxalis oulophora]
MDVGRRGRADMLRRDLTMGAHRQNYEFEETHVASKSRIANRKQTGTTICCPFGFVHSGLIFWSGPMVWSSGAVDVLLDLFSYANEDSIDVQSFVDPVNYSKVGKGQMCGDYMTDGTSSCTSHSCKDGLHDSIWSIDNGLR